MGSGQGKNKKTTQKQEPQPQPQSQSQLQGNPPSIENQKKTEAALNQSQIIQQPPDNKNDQSKLKDGKASINNSKVIKNDVSQIGNTKKENVNEKGDLTLDLSHISNNYDQMIINEDLGKRLNFEKELDEKMQIEDEDLSPIFAKEQDEK